MAWQCDKCGNTNPNASGNCIHCGAFDGGFGQMNVDNKEPFGNAKLSSRIAVSSFVAIIISIIVLGIFTLLI